MPEPTVATGVVKFFKETRGWGAIASDALPAPYDAFVHFSVIEGTGYRVLAAGDLVEFEYEAAQQDSFRFVATRVTRLASGPAPTLRRRGDEVRIEPEGSPETPLRPRVARPSDADGPAPAPTADLPAALRGSCGAGPSDASPTRAAQRR